MNEGKLMILRVLIWVVVTFLVILVLSVAIVYLPKWAGVETAPTIAPMQATETAVARMVETAVAVMEASLVEMETAIAEIYATPTAGGD